MEIEIATERSILVELSAAELHSLGLTYDRIGAENEQTKAALRSILCEIQNTTGRAFSWRHVEVDVLPSRGGGCLVIVSDSPVKPNINARCDLCAFDNLDGLLDCVKALKSACVFSRVELLYEKEKWILLIYNASENDRRLIGEFGTLQKLTPFARASIRERFVLLEEFGGTCTKL